MLHLIGRNKELFTEDINQHEKELQQIVSGSVFGKRHQHFPSTIKIL